jgi:Putative rhamnosyl transferase
MVLVHVASLNGASSGGSFPRRRKSASTRLLVALFGLWAVCSTTVKLAHILHSTESNPGLHRSMMAAVAAPSSYGSPYNVTVNAAASSSSLWRSNYNVVHVIQTRFMQNQPNLVVLGQARLNLFRALTIPSIQHQTVQHFLWIVRTDPALDPTLKVQLIAALSNVSNAVLVASNANPEGFRAQSCVADITTDTLLSGSLDMVRSYHEAAARQSVLETRCDADDAVAVDFVEMIQASASMSLRQDWMVWCAENHLEWQYDSPWNDTHGLAGSSIPNPMGEQHSEPKGALLALKAGKCVTPGLTWGYTVNASRLNIPVSKHHQIQKVVPACASATSKKATGLHSKCLVKLGDDLPLALRARTPTSAGMDHILIKGQTEKSFPMEQLQRSKARNTQNTLWESLPVLFGVDASNLWSVRTYIHDNFRAIVRDALVGQCTRGHSCKDGSREVLQRLLSTSRQP